MQLESDSHLGVVAGHVRSLNHQNLTPRLWQPYIHLSLFLPGLCCCYYPFAEILFRFTQFGTLVKTMSCSPLSSPGRVPSRHRRGYHIGWSEVDCDLSVSSRGVLKQGSHCVEPPQRTTMPTTSSLFSISVTCSFSQHNNKTRICGWFAQEADTG